MNSCSDFKAHGGTFLKKTLLHFSHFLCLIIMTIGSLKAFESIEVILCVNTGLVC